MVRPQLIKGAKMIFVQPEFNHPLNEKLCSVVGFDAEDIYGLKYLVEFECGTQFYSKREWLI